MKVVRKNKSFSATRPQTDASIRVQLSHCSLYSGHQPGPRYQLRLCYTDVGSQQPTAADSADVAAITTVSVDDLMVTEDGHGSWVPSQQL